MDGSKRMSEYKERDCENCEYHKEVYSKTFGMFVHTCTSWDCVQEKKDNDEPDLDCALRE